MSSQNNSKSGFTIHYVSVAADDYQSAVTKAEQIFRKTSGKKVMTVISIYDACEAYEHIFDRQTPYLSMNHIREAAEACAALKELSYYKWIQLEKFSMTRYCTIDIDSVDYDTDEEGFEECKKFIYTYLDEGDIEKPSEGRYLVVAIHSIQ